MTDGIETMRRGSLTRCSIVLAVCAVALSACGSSESESPSATGPTGSQPGAEEFGLSLEQLALRVDAVEAEIGTCMAAAGFEYVPVDFTTIKAAMDSDGTAPGVNSDDFIAQFGYGISTRPGEPDAVALNGKGEQNAALYAALAPNDQIAYDRALYGEDPDATFARALESEDLSGTGGCTRTAIEQNFATDELSSAYVNPADTRVDNDKRMIDALAEWSDCVREGGYEYDHPDDIPDDLVTRLEATLDGQDPASVTGPALDALTELQGYERAVAAAAQTCEEDIVEPVQEQIELEIFGAPPS